MDLIKNNLKCVAQVCLLVIGILASSLNIQCYGASDLEAPNTASSILSRLEMGKVVDCQTRVEFAKSVINNHSTASGETVTMRTPIPELMELWNRDYAFVVSEMELAHAKLPDGASCQSFDVPGERLVRKIRL